MTQQLADELADVDAFQSMTIEELRGWLLRRKGRVNDGRVEKAEAVLDAKLDYRDAGLAKRADRRATLALVVSCVGVATAVAALLVNLT